MDRKMAIRVFNYTDTGIYWTLPVYITYTVGDVCQAICDKLGGDTQAGYMLIRRTKRAMGITKDKVLKKDVRIADVDSAQKKKKKEYALLIAACKDNTAADSPTSPKNAPRKLGVPTTKKRSSVILEDATARILASEVIEQHFDGDKQKQSSSLTPSDSFSSTSDISWSSNTGESSISSTSMSSGVSSSSASTSMSSGSASTSTRMSSGVSDKSRYTQENEANG